MTKKVNMDMWGLAMNEKFFDLKKEKQDRMINAGLQIFALNGYRHASTDEIVKEAGISKGLLFHYFGSKAGYYAFLYDYATRYAFLELSSEIRIKKDAPVSFFALERDILRVEEHLLAQYPYLYLFLQSCKLEQDEEALSNLAASIRPVSQFYDELFSSPELLRSSSLPEATLRRLTDIVHHVRFGTMRELLAKSGSADVSGTYRAQMSSAIDALERLAQSSVRL